MLKKFLTSNRVDYVSHPMGKIDKHKYEAWEKPEGDIDLLTSYIKDYPGENVFFFKLKLPHQICIVLVNVFRNLDNFIELIFRPTEAKFVILEFDG